MIRAKGVGPAEGRPRGSVMMGRHEEEKSSPPPAAAPRAEDQNQHQYNQNNPEKVHCAFLLIGGVIITAVQIVAVGLLSLIHGYVAAADLGQPLEKQRKYRLHPRVVIALGKFRLQRGIDQGFHLAPGKLLFHPGAGQQVIILLIDGQQKQQAVLLLLVANVPVVKQVIGVIRDVCPAGGRNDHHHKLRTAILIEQVVGKDDHALGVFRQHVGAVIDVEIRVGRHHRQGGQRHQRQTQKPCKEFLFHPLHRPKVSNCPTPHRPEISLAGNAPAVLL